MPPELIIFLLSMSPLGDLRVAIPLGLGLYKLSIAKTMVLAVAGGTVPPILILLGFPRVAAWCCARSLYARRCYAWLEHRTRIKFETEYAHYGAGLALAIFIGIPFPFTGAWAAAFAAILFGISKRIAIPAIVVGNAFAAALVTAATLGIVHIVT